MNLKEYIRIQLDKKVPLEVIYEELPRMDYKAREIYITVNEIIIENINKTIDDYLKKKNE